MCPSVCWVGTKVGAIEMTRWLRFAIRRLLVCDKGKCRQQIFSQMWNSGACVELESSTEEMLHQGKKEQVVPTDKPKKSSYSNFMARTGPPGNPDVSESSRSDG